LTPDLVILLNAGCIEIMNDAGRRMLGGSCSEEFVGKSVIDLVYPDDRELFRRQITALTEQSGDAPGMEQRLLRLDGETVRVEVRAVGVTIGGEQRMLVMAHDITDRKQAEEAHARSAYVRELIEVSLDPMVTIGQDGRITDVNRATEDATGISHEKLIGSDFSTYFTEPDKARAGYERAFSEGFVRDYPLAIRHPSGRVIEVLYNATVYRDESGNVIGVFAAARDVTDRNRVEQRQVEIEAHKLDFYRRTILAATGGKLVITECEEIDRIAGRPDAQWDLTAAEQLRHIRADIADIAESAGMDSSGVHRLLTCVGEATSNAIKHAGAGTVSLHRSDRCIIVRVEDNGSGIDALNLPDVALTIGFTTAEDGGLGYKMMIAAADKVYLATGPDGTTVAAELSLRPDETLPLDPAWP
jgi:PAS domain S-box-containing protein